MTSRPFRSPHHSASTIAMTGGGNNALPGEITLSHRGVLLLDEMPEFTRETLEALRQPLEDRVITVSRAKATVRYPANFILAATANPCPCGFYASTQDCECATSAILRYQRKLSGPILDRIDLHVAVEAVSHDKLLHPVKGADDTDYRAQVLRARERQLKRFGGQQLNANMTNAEVKQYALLKHDAETLLNEAATRLRLSPRVYIRLIKVARTIADLDNSQHIVTHHILEALQYRNTSFAAHV